MPLDWGVLGSPVGSGASRWSVAEGSPRSDGGWPRPRSLSSASSLGAPPSSEPDSDDTPFQEEEDGGGQWGWALSATLASLRGITPRPVPVTPGGSRIPVRTGTRTRTGTGTEPALGEWHTPGEYPSGIQESLLETDADLSAEYLPFDLRKFLEHDPRRDGADQMIAELQKHLATARHRIQTLEKQLNGTVCSDQQIQAQLKAGRDTDSQFLLTKWLTSELHSKEQLLQQCLDLLRQLLSGSTSVWDVKTDLVEKLRDQLQEREGELQVNERRAPNTRPPPPLPPPNPVSLSMAHELSERHREVLASEAEKVRSLRTQLSAREQEVAKLQTLQSTRVQECLTELEDLRGILEHKDQVILGMTLDFDLHAVGDDEQPQELPMVSPSCSSLWVFLNPVNVDSKC
ncbi:uncharacterized protein [Chiloscyllium punctatum]|uniref:uncharacterized protein n=1 Tax=Chiloscyllium punctatum TaxID=137246 RepID=UPI003B632F27